jgi:heme-degrading monooxygenase HmoA
MYIRMVFVKVKQGKMDDFRNTYEKEVIPIVKAHKGHRYIHLLECRENESEGISVTSWDSEGDYEAYIKSGDFERTAKTYSPLFAEEPIEKSYEVTASSEPLILRIF